jgi:hypothetical protein
MIKESFCLSEKINEAYGFGAYGFGDPALVISKADVKEFIRLLKEEIHTFHGITTQAHHNIWLAIDKLAGEKLI